MDFFDDYLSNIDSPVIQEKMREILKWVETTFPDLEPRIAWNQPMFVRKGTFIIGFSYSKKHISVSPEKPTLDKFREELKNQKYEATSMIFKIKLDDDINYSLLKEMIEFNIIDKDNYPKFWR